MPRISTLLLAFATFSATLVFAPATAHTGECYDLGGTCIRDCTIEHLRQPGPHFCVVWAESAGPEIRYEQCRPPEFGYAVYVNGQQVAWCAI